MGFRLRGLEPSKFRHLFGKTDAQLKQQHAVRLAAEPGFPCRVTLRDAEPGEPVLLLNYAHHEASTPYRSSGPIFVREGKHEMAEFENSVPPEMRGRLYSARAYDSEGFMIDADVAEGTALEALIERLFSDERTAYLHLHHARRGCFACTVERT